MAIFRESYENPIGYTPNVIFINIPADFTFRKIAALQGDDPDKCRTSRLGKRPPRGGHNKLMTNSVWVNNNRLRTTAHLSEFLESIIEEPSTLKWIDFSYNKISEIDMGLLEFEELRIIYMHGNRIADLKEIAKLKGLPNLITLTLHGNPITLKNCYRQHVLLMLPQLHNLDFSAVTCEERSQAAFLNLGV